jgi:hypothetical protein
MDSKFIVELNGKPHPLYAGILSEAHERGLASIETSLIQVPTEENGHTAIVKAVVTMKDGSRFEGYGDANPRNVNPRIATALLRMSETRAKGRALRDAINCGQTMLEELPDLEEHGHSEHAGRPAAVVYRAEPQPRQSIAEAPARPAVSEATSAAPAADANGNGKPVCSTPACGKGLTKGQYDVSMQRFGQPLCPTCQKSHVKVG